jgi:DNA-binding transcriptional LysR family regulator
VRTENPAPATSLANVIQSRFRLAIPSLLIPTPKPGKNKIILTIAATHAICRLAVTPRVIAEFDDSALMKACGQHGLGVFPAPIAIRDEIENMYHSRMIGAVDGVEETYYSISPERKLKHPAVLTITETARENLFGDS